MKSTLQILKEEFKNGNCDDITSTPNPDFKEPFYQSIIRLMDISRGCGNNEDEEFSGTTFDQWMAIVHSICGRKCIQLDFKSDNWEYLYDLGYSAGDAIYKFEEL